MGDHSTPKGQPRKRPGSAWWRCEQMGHEGGPAQPNEGGEGHSKSKSLDIVA